MKAALRISIKDYHRKEILRILRFPPRFRWRQFQLRMNGACWPASGEPGLLTRLVTDWGKSLVRAGRVGDS